MLFYIDMARITVNYRIRENSRQSESSSVHDKELLSLLENFKQIVQHCPDACSYSFVRDIYQLYSKYSTNTGILTMLMDWLISDVGDAGGISGEEFQQRENASVDFAVYYFLALYCKRKQKTVHATLSLDNLIDKFGYLFSGYVLSLEVRSWHARRLELLDNAYMYDQQMIRLLDIRTNAGVYNSFASSVCLRLEKEYESQRNGQSIYYWKNPTDRYQDWNRAVQFMPEVIAQWKKVWNSKDGYGKHYFIYGKLLMYAPDLPKLLPEEKKKRLAEAKQMFRIAKSCENPDDADYTMRYNEYEKFAQDCDRISTEMLHHQNSAQGHTMQVSAATRINTRSGLGKPNEDFYICDDHAGLFLIADGVTRPHQEYQEDSESISAECAQLLCRTVHQHLLYPHDSDPEQAIREALLEGNRAIRPLRYCKPNTYVPCSTFLCAVIRGSTLYYYSCCDTVAYLLRGGVKIQLTEQYNPSVILQNYTKEQIYSRLHNNIDEPHGFAIMNGDDSISEFLNISHIQLEEGDRIILASDGLYSYLRYARASELSSCTVEQMMMRSTSFDSPPFQKYGDDKTCIVIDI